MRTRKLKKVSFESKGRRITFLAKRAAKSAYARSKPQVKRVAAYSKRQGVRAAKYGYQFSKREATKAAKGIRQRVRDYDKGVKKSKQSGSPMVKCPYCGNPMSRRR